MSPTPATEHGVVAGNVYDKYGSRNPLVRRMMAGFLTAFDELVEASGQTRVHEVGCGEGVLSRRLAERGFTVLASDLSQPLIEQARQPNPHHNLEFEVCDLYSMHPTRHQAPLVICCEVLEHLEAPERGLEVLRDLARPYLLVSVPREPLWRLLNLLRLRYVRHLGNTPGHLNHWSARSFRRLLERQFEIVEFRHPLPWSMALCRHR